MNKRNLGVPKRELMIVPTMIAFFLVHLTFCFL